MQHMYDNNVMVYLYFAYCLKIGLSVHMRERERKRYEGRERYMKGEREMKGERWMEKDGGKKER